MLNDGRGGHLNTQALLLTSSLGVLLAPCAVSLLPSVASVSFKIMDAPAVDLPIGDAAQLGLHLAVFGSDEEMPRSRLLAEKIATAVSIAGRDGAAILHLTESQKDVVSIALDAMIDDRAGNLSDALIELRAACR